MGRKLAGVVHVPDASGVWHVFGPGDDVPGWAVERITNPKAWAGKDAHEVPVAPPTQAAPADTPAAPAKKAAAKRAPAKKAGS